MIADELDTPQNFSGCLNGQVNDYLEGFDSEIDKLEGAFNKNHSHWTTQIKEAKNFESLRRAEMATTSQKIKSQLHSMLELPVEQIEQYVEEPMPATELVEKSLKQESVIDWNYPARARTPFKLIKTTCFGKGQPTQGEYFEWPSEQESQQLSKAWPFKLKEIKTRGYKYMSAIQLVFDNGITCLIDTMVKSSTSDVFHSTNVLGQTIKDFKAGNHNQQGQLRNLQVTLDCGATLDIYDNSSTTNKLCPGSAHSSTTPIPPNSQVVGFYGYKYLGYLMGLGFIVAI